MGTYDKCIKQEIIEKLSKLCLLPFIEEDNSTSDNVSVCTSFEEGLKALSVFQASSSQCKNPCTQTSIDVHETTEYYLYNIANDVKNYDLEAGYYINLPKLVRTSELQENYGFTSVVAEIGGLTGLFLGFSVLGLCSRLPGLRSNKQYKTVCNILKWIVILFRLICISYISHQQFIKLQRNERSSYIMIDDQYFNLSISLCSLDNSFQGETYVANTTEFWKERTKLGKKIRNLSIQFKNDSIWTVFDEASQLNLIRDLKNINIPKYDQFIEFCSTIALNQFEVIQKIELITKEEITVYVHYNGQLLNLNNQRGTTNISPLTLVIWPREFDIYFSTSEVSAEYAKFSSVASDNYTKMYTFDDCIIQNIASELQEIDIYLFLGSEETTTFTHGINLTEFEKLNQVFHRVQSRQYCKNPFDTVQIRYFQEKINEKT